MMMTTTSRQSLRNAVTLAVCDLQGIARRDERETSLGKVRVATMHLPQGGMHAVFAWEEGRPSILAGRPVDLFAFPRTSLGWESPEGFKVDLAGFATADAAWLDVAHKLADSLASTLPRFCADFAEGYGGCYVDFGVRGFIDGSLRVLAFAIGQGWAPASPSESTLGYLEPDDREGIIAELYRLSSPPSDEGLTDLLFELTDEATDWLNDHRCEPSVRFEFVDDQESWCLVETENEEV